MSNKDNKPKDFTPPAGETPPEETPTPVVSGTQADVTNSRMMVLAANISTFNRLGTALPEEASEPISRLTYANNYYHKTARRIPGMEVLSWIPTLGPASSKTDAVNVAADKAYRTDRAANSGARNYDSPDLMLVDLCTDSIVSLWHEVHRVHGLVTMASAENMYYGKPLVKALGYDYDDLRSKGANLAFMLEQWKQIISTLSWIPDFKYHEVHRALSDAIYIDGSIAKTQIYAFRQAAFYCYGDADMAKGVRLERMGTTGGGGRLTTLSDIEQLMDKMLSSLMNSTDFSVITGDIQKAWGESSVVTLPEVGFITPVTVHDNDPIKCAIMNATVLPIDIDTAIGYDGRDGIFKCQPKLVSTKYNSEGDYLYLDGVFGYDGDYIICRNPSDAMKENLRGVRFWGASNANRILNFIEANPDPAAVGNATRFVVRSRIATEEDLANGIADNVNDIIPYVFGTELIVGATLHSIWRDSNGAWDLAISTPVFSEVVCGYQRGDGQYVLTQDNFVNGVQAITNFDWHHPVMYCVLVNPANALEPTLQFAWKVCDYQNAAVAADSTIEKIHTARLLAAFDY